MKNKSNIIIGIVAVVVVVICFFATSGVDSTSGEKENGNTLSVQQIIQKAQSESAAIEDDEKKELELIDVDEYLDIYECDQEALVFLGSSECGYCAVAQPIVENIAYEYDLDIYYLNAAEFSEDEKSDFISSNELFSDGYGTPMLLLVSEGKIHDTVDGLSHRDGYLEYLEENRIIKE